VLLGWSQAPKSWATPSTDPSTVLAARDAPALRSAAAARIAAIVLYGNPHWTADQPYNERRHLRPDPRRHRPPE
jgi:hypothetical protein